MTGTEHRVTSAYQPQSNGLCERQNRTIKEALVKVLDEKAVEWPYIIEGILFAHRVSKHTSTKYSPFFLLYNREPTLPVDVKYRMVDIKKHDIESFDRETFDAVLTSFISLREKVYHTAFKNIQTAQNKQQKDYNKRYQAPHLIGINDKVLLKIKKG
ncbi:uncharacterized protein LOC136088021 [Hydra vulgaris]|uniref:Uncharacterized protein LOC136088021 n=1 Tax=Hydra vulgaris TaxID=6087 RepID=A0ABM4D0J4_HYDVU